MKRAAQLFDQLDATTGVNAKVDALAAYFREADPRDRVRVIALLSGKRPKRVVNSTLLRQWAADAASIPLWLFEECYHTVGDLAETVMHLVPQGTHEERSLDAWVRVVEELRSADDAEKERSVKAAWSALGGTERFIFNKIITGGFRIGVSRTVMVKGLSAATGVPEDVLALRLMGQWDPATTSFDTLVLHTEGEQRDTRPYPFYLAYGIEGPDGTASGATLSDLHALGDRADWQVEYKWDGIRGQAIVRNGALYLWSRGEDLVTDRYPDLAGLVERLPHGTVIDGELMAWRDGAPLPFAEMQRRIGRKTIGRKLMEEVPVVLMAYDLLEHAGTDIREKPLHERRALLEQVVHAAGSDRLLLSPLVEAPGWEAVAEARDKAHEGAAEGVMLKHRDSAYGVGRRKGHWWKWKQEPRTVDAVLTFSMAGHGRRADLYTDHTFGLWHKGELVTFAKAYSGLTDAEMKKVDGFVRRNTLARFGPVRQVKPELVFEIAFEGVNLSTRHKSGVAVRFPRIVRWRHDKPAAEADTLDHLKAMVTPARNAAP